MSHPGAESVPIRIDSVVAVHWVLATLLSLPVVPFFLSDHANSMYDAIDAADVGQVTTSYLFAFKALRTVPDVWPLVLVSVAHPFTPTIAAFLIAGFVIKRGSVRELVNRYRFWRGIRWQHGLTTWFIAVITAAMLSLLSAVIGLTFAADESFTWHAQLLCPAHSGLLFSEQHLLTAVVLQKRVGGVASSCPSCKRSTRL